MKRTKVCHLTSVHPVTDPRIFHKECRTLARAGYEVVLIGPAPRETVSHDVLIRPLKQSKTRVTRRLFGVWRVFRMARQEQAAVYHFHDPELIPIALLLKWVTDARVVYDMHEYYSEVRSSLAHPAVRRAWRALWHLLLEAIPVRIFDLTVYPTDSLSAEFPQTKSSLTVRNLPTLDATTQMVTKGYAKADADFDVVVVGTVSPFRLEFMLAIAEELVSIRGELRWLFLGLPQGSLDWLATNKRRSSLIANHIVAMSRVPHEEVYDYLSRSAVGFNYHPSEKRFLVAIPMKVFEYMLAGRPAVSTGLPELADLLSDGENCVLVESESERDYATAIMSLLDDPARAAEIGQRGKLLIEESLNWDACEAAKLSLAYEELLNG